MPQVGSVCQGSSGWVLNRPGSSRTASSRLTKTSRLSSRRPSDSATNKVCVHFNSIIVIWKNKSGKNMLWMLYLKWDFWVSVKKICFPATQAKNKRQLSFWLAKAHVAKISVGLRVCICLRKTCWNKTNCHRSIVDEEGWGETTVDGCGLQEGGWGADSSDRTLFICRLKCQHSTPETSTQSSGVCTLTLTAEMRSVCSKKGPSTQRPLSGTSQFLLSVR